MSPNDTRDERRTDAEQQNSVRPRMRRSAATGELDESLIELLTFMLDTDTRARIYLYLRQQPGATSDEIATGTGLYPSTVRESLAVLHEEGVVRRHERELSGTDGPYVYESIPPKELVLDILEPIQEKLNRAFMLDELLGVDGADRDRTPRGEPIQRQARDHEEERDGEQDRERAQQRTPITVTVTESAFRSDDR